MHPRVSFWGEESICDEEGWWFYTGMFPRTGYLGILCAGS